MINRIRVVTMLMMVLGVFALLQLVCCFLHCSRISKVLLFLTIFDSSKVNSPQRGI